MPAEEDERHKRIVAAEEADLLRARKLPSHFANRAFIRTVDGTTRITLGEVILVGEPTVWVSSFVIPTQEAVSIANLIIEQAQYEADRQAYFDDLANDWDPSQVGDQGKPEDA